MKPRPPRPASRRRRQRGARTLWALGVLGLLSERPMHPYEMQRQMHIRHTDDLLALKRGSLYHAINQLQRDGLIEPVETSREGRWPERTVYRITPDGDDELVVWLCDLLSTPVREPSQFTAGLAHILHLSPTDALAQLQMRVVNLEAAVAALSAIERGVGGLIGRGSILEVEYARSLAQAEIDWVRSIIDDLRTRKLTWEIGKINAAINITTDDLDKHSDREGTRHD
jgi:DNA-binding PadR family transcriptional regulator